MKKAKKAIALFVIGIIGLVLSGCAVLTGGAVGLATAALTRNDKLGVAAGLATTAAVLGWEKRARAAELAQGTEDCSRQEVIQNGRLVTDNLICNSRAVRPGFRGDPLPHGPRVPPALGPRPIEPRTQRIRIEARGRPQTLSFHE